MRIVPGSRQLLFHTCSPTSGTKENNSQSRIVHSIIRNRSNQSISCIKVVRHRQTRQVVRFKLERPPLSVTHCDRQCPSNCTSMFVFLCVPVCIHVLFCAFLFRSVSPFAFLHDSEFPLTCICRCVSETYARRFRFRWCHLRKWLRHSRRQLDCLVLSVAAVALLVTGYKDDGTCRRSAPFAFGNAEVGCVIVGLVAVLR